MKQLPLLHPHSDILANEKKSGGALPPSSVLVALVLCKVLPQFKRCYDKGWIGASPMVVPLVFPPAIAIMKDPPINGNLLSLCISLGLLEWIVVWLWRFALSHSSKAMGRDH